MAPASNGPTRRTPLDGLNPVDFDQIWPNGYLVKPLALRQQGLTPTQLQAWMDGVTELQALAHRYVAYLKWRGTTQEAVAAEWKVSSNRLSAFRAGTGGWPSGPLVAILRSQIPPEEVQEHYRLYRHWVDRGRPMAV